MAANITIPPAYLWTLSSGDKNAMISLTVIILLLGVIGVVIALLNYKTFRPFRSKQLGAVVVSLGSAIIWDISSLQSIGVFDMTTTNIWGVCALWPVVGQVTFGVSLYLSVMVFRFYRLYYIICLTKAAEGYQFWMVVGGSWAPSFLLGILALALPGTFVSISPTSDPTHPQWGSTCSWNSSVFLYLLYANVIGQLSLLFYLNYKISTIRSAFNEFRENQIALGITFIGVLVDAGVVMGGASYLVWGKWVLFCIIIFASNNLLWAVMAGPVFGFLFRRAAYLKNFDEGMVDKSLHGAAHGTGATSGFKSTLSQTKTASDLKKIMGPNSSNLSTKPTSPASPKNVGSSMFGR